MQICYVLPLLHLISKKLWEEGNDVQIPDTILSIALHSNIYFIPSLTQELELEVDLSIETLDGILWSDEKIKTETISTHRKIYVQLQRFEIVFHNFYHLFLP